MNSNRLTFKDYILIYFFIFLLAAFLGGFFLGAKVMESQLRNYPNTDSNNAEASPTFSRNEIAIFNDKIFEPAREWNKEVYKVIYTNNIQHETNTAKIIEDGEFLLTNIKIYTFDSQFLKEAVKSIEKNIELSIEAINQQDQQLISEANGYYLSSQKNFYRSIWVWEQVSNNPDKKTSSETMIDWNEWVKSGLHQKNYILAIILEKEEINTFVRPEDITVHIDAYLKSGSNTSIDLNEVIKLLVSSDSVHDNDFKRYKEFYPNTNFPNIDKFE